MLLFGRQLLASSSSSSKTMMLLRVASRRRCRSSQLSQWSICRRSFAAANPRVDNENTAVSSSASSSSSSAAAAPLLTLGIPRETYNPWERRAALTPNQVQELLNQNQGRLAVTVQSSARRIFADQEYHQAGATVVYSEDDLYDHCDLILGVKRPVSIAAPNKTYLFFSHTIKGQPENMALLQECLDKNVQLIDYERITTAATGKRLVSFGRFAGIAGTMDSFPSLGRKLLCTSTTTAAASEGASTPFLSFPPAILHDTLDDARDRLRRLGERIHCEGIRYHEPLVFCVTGLGGCVHRGAMEILQMLPHEIVPVEDLPAILESTATDSTKKKKNKSKTAAAAPPPPLQYKIHVVPVGMDDVFARCDDGSYDRQDFQRHPTQYRSLFAKRVAPHAHCIINCAYWDARFPRLLTKRQMKRLWEDGNQRLQLVTDISCDVNGSIEFLERTTTIESPSFQYDPLLEREVNGDIGQGITVMGVDILPTELPKESSAHFGDKVMGVVKELLDAKEKQKVDYAGVDTSLLSPGLSDACITANGSLEPGFQYLKTLMERVPKDNLDAQSTMTISLEGHLFDTSLINQILDVIEQYGTGLEFKECFFPPQSGRETSRSNVIMKIDAADDETLGVIEHKISTLVEAIERACATAVRLDKPKKSAAVVPVPDGSAHVGELKPEKRVLLLGAGRVSKSFVDYLGRATNAVVTVASDREEEARETASAAVKGKHVAMDVVNDMQRLSAIIEDSDVVVSLLPAPMHPPVARECIVHGKHFVTASYESEEMRALNKRAQEANVMVLNEVGLDPGLDHMSAMKIIDHIKGRGGKITGFTSVCGGLPEPKSANNPLKYKFSWSPRGVIRASQNNARYRWAGQVMEVKGSQLLQSAAPFLDAWNDHQLECLPNRDSLHYEDIYGIQGVSSLFRGTLRYRGFSSLMDTFQNAGLFDESSTAAGSWSELIDELRASRGGFDSVDDFIRACADDDTKRGDEALSALQWLDMLGEKPISAGTIVDAFCQALERKLVYREGEHDLVLMHHTIDASFENGDEERHFSSLYVLGDDSMTAMSKTVGFTAAASAELILDGDLDNKSGLLLPTDPEIYLPVLDKLKLEGIVFSESAEVYESRRRHSQ